MGTTHENLSDEISVGQHVERGDVHRSVVELLERRRTNEEALSPDEVFELLKNRRRRDVLEYLEGQPDRAATLDDLATHIAARENEIDAAQLSSSQRKRVYIGLYQTHLPKMDEFGVVEYDQNRGTVVLEDVSQLEPHLSVMREERRGEPALLGATGAVGVVAALGLLGVAPLGAVPTEAWTVVMVLLLFGLIGYLYLQ